MPPDTSLASSILLPGSPPATRARVPRAYPAYVILVHGVNDVGEAYASQETGICEGLNDRLCRGDLKPAQYVIPDRTTAQGTQDLRKYMDEPEFHFFRRSPQQGAYSPIIPFYWGFREEEAKIQKHTKHGQWLDQYGNRVDRDGSKNGGPFANACSALTDMWEQGFHNMAKGILSLNWVGGSPTHPLLDAGSRRYMVLAAKRLAMLITIIRDHHFRNQLPPAAINLVTHSQGCLLALLAHAFLADEQKTPGDCLIMNNPPFSLEESYVDGSTQLKDRQQSTHARVTTLKEIVTFLTKAPATSPAFKPLLDPLKNQLLTGQEPGKVKHPHTGQDHAFEDRDNRGRVFLYFSPRDLTVGLTSIQGIGWQGVPDRMRYTIDRTKREWDVLATLGDRFHQRVWTDLERDQAPPVLVGSAERGTYILRGKKSDDGDFWKWAKSHTARAVPCAGATRTLQAPKVPIPWQPNLAYGEKQGTAGFLEVSPIDAAVAVTNKGEKRTTDLTTADPIAAATKSKFVNDPRTPWERPGDVRGGSERLLSGLACAQVTAGLNQGKEARDCIEVLSAQAHGGNRLEIIFRESFREAQERWMLQEYDANSYHSGIVSNPEHSRRVTAYDLAIGPIYASIEKEKMTKWMKENEDFLEYLRGVADWRKTTKKFQLFANDIVIAPFYKQEPPPHKALMEATAHYYYMGELPAGLKGTETIKEGEWKIPSLVKCETVSEVSIRNMLPILG